MPSTSLAPAAARPQALLVDLDGTLVDTAGDFQAALSATLADLGAPELPPGFVERTVGRGGAHLLRTLLAEVGLNVAAHFDLAWARYQAHYPAVNGRYARPYPGAIEAVQAWHAAGLPMACVTNKPTAWAQTLLQAMGLAPYFRWVFGGDAFPERKPHPLPLLKACEALGSTPSCTWMVGDSRNDAQAARAAGCPVVLVRGGYNHGEAVEDAAPDAVIDRLDAWPFAHVLPVAETAGRRAV